MPAWPWPTLTMSSISGRSITSDFKWVRHLRLESNAAPLQEVAKDDAPVASKGGLQRAKAFRWDSPQDGWPLAITAPSRNYPLRGEARFFQNDNLRLASPREVIQFHC